MKVWPLLCLLLAGCASYQAEQLRADPIYRACSGRFADSSADCFARDGGGEQTRQCLRQIMTQDDQARIANCLGQAMAIQEMLTPPPAVQVSAPVFTSCTSMGTSTNCMTY